MASKFPCLNNSYCYRLWPTSLIFLTIISHLQCQVHYPFYIVFIAEESFESILMFSVATRDCFLVHFLGREQGFMKALLDMTLNLGG